MAREESTVMEELRTLAQHQLAVHSLGLCCSASTKIVNTFSDGSVKEVLRKALKKRLDQPHLPGSELHRDLQGCYKIKLRQQSYRLVYSVEDDVLVILVLAVDKREDMVAYRSALTRLLAVK